MIKTCSMKTVLCCWKHESIQSDWIIIFNKISFELRMKIKESNDRRRGAVIKAIAGKKKPE